MAGGASAEHGSSLTAIPLFNAYRGGVLRRPPYTLYVTCDKCKQNVNNYINVLYSLYSYGIIKKKQRSCNYA